MPIGSIHESSTFTEKIDTAELLINCIQENEDRASDLINTVENLLYLKSRHESVTPGNLASHVVHRGSRRGDRRP